MALPSWLGCTKRRTLAVSAGAKKESAALVMKERANRWGTLTRPHTIATGTVNVTSPETLDMTDTLVTALEHEEKPGILGSHMTVELTQGGGRRTTRTPLRGDR
ncbi:hypothetical protein [Luteococcus sp. OSA5]|uniref:hypothetical protein n=1 Tax=Luteococcus sp. OSA5 TaxID=3401630 RepID=UPI003B43C0AB